MSFVFGGSGSEARGLAKPITRSRFIFLSPLGERLGEAVQRENCLLHHPLTQPLPQGG